MLPFLLHASLFEMVQWTSYNYSKQQGACQPEEQGSTELSKSLRPYPFEKVSSFHHGCQQAQGRWAAHYQFQLPKGYWFLR